MGRIRRDIEVVITTPSVGSVADIEIKMDIRKAASRNLLYSRLISHMLVYLKNRRYPKIGVLSISSLQIPEV